MKYHKAMSNTNTFTSIDIETLNENPFKLIGKDWMLITAEKDGRTNMMTASWGGLGVLWNKNVATIYIRKSRFTKEFVDDGDTFTLCVMDEKYRKELGYCGSKSGRDEDKIKATGFTVEHADKNCPYFAEARLVFVCKKLYAQEMNADSFTNAGKDLPAKFYADNDWHVLYVAEIEKILKAN